MKKRAFALFFALILLFFMVAFTTTCLADAGNFTSDVDWGDMGDWDGSSWDSYDSYGYDDYGYDNYGGGIFFGLFDIGGIFVLVIIAAAFMFVFVKRKKTSHNRSNYRFGESNDPGIPISVLKQKDAAFSETELLDKVGNLYICMQEAWENKKWLPMRAHMTDNLYNQFARQLDELIDRGYTNHMERICVMNSFIKRYQQDARNDILTIELTARLIDYTVDADDNVISGSRTREKYLTYEWILIRDKDAKTLASEGLQTVSCPNCGAPVDVAKSAQCDYCGTVVTVDSREWVISAIRGISQRTAG